MSPQHDVLFNQVLSLPPIDRAQLIEKLIQSFNPTPASQKELDAAWSREANDRWNAYLSGEMKASSVEDVMARIEQHLSRS
jgi:putative addiction module component (TIGR02574 family)